MNKTTMKYALTLIAAFISLCAFSQRDATRYLTELRNYKHEYMIRELELTQQQTREFFAVYDAMEDSLKAYNDSVRAVEAAILALEEPNEEEVTQANELIYNQTFREAEIERNAYERLGDILSPRQLLRLKSAERSFNQSLMRQHRRNARMRQNRREAE